VELIRDDGRRFVARTEERFDAVIVAARPPRCAQSNRYHTLEFVEAVRRALAPEGSVTLLAPGGANVLAPEAARAAASAAATVGAVFEHVVLVPGLEISIHASSSKGVVSDDPAVLADRLLSRGARTPSFSPRRFESLLEPGRIARLREQIDAWPGRINTDARPFAYLSNLQLWERSLSGDRGAGGSTWTGAAERWAPAWLAIPLFLWAVWRIPRRARSPSGDAIFSIATTGAAAMAVEIVVLYAFQAASGRVYTGMAAIVGVFMAGLGLGAHLGRRLPRGLSAAGGAVADGAVLALLLASGPALAAAASAAWLAVAWSALAGAVTGAAFPVLIGLAAARRAGDERRLASSFEAADHAGAALGGFATGVIWLPVWGIETTCLLLCGLKVAALAGQILGIRSGRAGR